MTPPAAPTTPRVKIREFADPLNALWLDALSSDESAEPTASVSIQSAAMRVLVSELRRYCNQEVGGRSFLISGHRGAGKTTMIQHAFRQVFRDSLSDRARLRPLYVQLHGPSLFPDFVSGAAPVAAAPATGRGVAATTAAPTAPPSGDGASGVAADAGAAATAAQSETVTVTVTAAQPAQSRLKIATPAVAPVAAQTAPDSEQSVSARDARLALEQITLALHRAVSREFVDAVWRKAVPSSRIAPKVDSFPRGRELAEAARSELAAAFEHELHECPSPMRLRDFWVRLGVARTGVLGLQRTGSQSSAATNSQGMRELVALAGVCDAYRRIAGHVEQSNSDTEDAAQRLEAALSVDTTGKSVVPAIASMLTGGLVGGGLALGDAGAIQATIGGFVAAMGSSLVYKWSVTRSRSRAVKREYKFLFDTSLGTLDRVLPVLLQRLLAAGLAPIFVVDELDKVDHLSDRIFGMVRHLKKLVAESAFFCFLTDRSYFEDMRSRGQRGAYPLEYSYFTHRLFVSYGHDHLHEYLGELLDEPNRRPAIADPGAPLPAHTTATPPEYPLLRYMLLHRSEMHALELHRLLKSIRGEDGTVLLELDDLRARATYRMDIGLQLGLEIIVDDSDLQERLRDEPEFQRLLQDALLYPSRMWRQGRMELEFTDHQQTEFHDYLVDRMNRSEATRAVEKLASSRTETMRACASDDVVELNDVKILWKKVQSYVQLLSDQGPLERRFGEWNDARRRSRRPPVDRAVLEPLLGKDNSLLKAVPGRPQVYRWRYDRFGVDPDRRVDSVKLQIEPERDPTTEAIDLITAFAERLATLQL